MPYGVDILSSVTNPTLIKNYHGSHQYHLEFIGRYPSTLSRSEVNAIHQAGLKIVAIKERGGASEQTTTYPNGVQDAQKAHDEYHVLGMPPNLPMYFAIDWNATTRAQLEAVEDYFKGVQHGLSTKGARYLPGMYGPTQACTYITDHTLMGYF